MLRAAFWVYAAFVLYLALTPMPPVRVSGWDKANHVYAFASLGVLGLASWPTRPVRMLAVLLAYGCLIEILQSFTPTRQADWHDVLADSVGLLVAVVIWFSIQWLARRWPK
ncbi:VanZ family protein [Ramlibacter paludis]|uniref:VanZ family protein n=1 Tax=Ramlibacter paludis TaxID=2908000 RepID=UPI003D2966EE